MGRYFSGLSSVAAPARLRAGTPAPSNNWWYQTPEGWTLPLEAAGISVTPELALTLSHVFCAVSTISDDFGTMSCQLFRTVDDDGRERVRYNDPGIGVLAYRLRWQPNQWQTAKAFWSTLAWQYLLRPIACAEIIYRPGSTSFIEELIPRHPDRVRQERLPRGALRFRLTEPNGTFRHVTQEEMFVVRNTSTDGLNALSRTHYGAKALASGLSLQDFTRNYFRKGATAALVGTYKGVKDEELEADLHTSITRYMSGVENAGGFLLVPEDIDVKSLGVEPEKAQLLGLKNLSGRDVARMFKMPPHKLMIEGAQIGYGSQVQAAQEYATGCQMPLAVEFEQSIQRDLIVARDQFFAKFNMDYLVRADLKTRMDAYAVGIQARVLRPSECRVKEDLSPDPRLDELSESDYRPGTSKSSSGGSDPNAVARAATSRGESRALLALHANAQRCLRRERAAVVKLATKFANDPDGWQRGLQDFYADHAGFISDTMRMHATVARAYAARHGAEFEERGMQVLDGADGERWERYEADELFELARDGDDMSVDRWFSRRTLVQPQEPA